jgi:uncharacterized lipoprotein YmbA
VRFYSLADANLAKSQAANSPVIAIEVLPVNVPERLKRPQIVITSKNTSQLKILEQDRWSSAFNDELQDAFVSGLSQQLNAIDISRGGRVANQPIYRIAIVLQQFTATPGEQVNANFGWAITRLNTDPRENKALSCQTTLSKTVGNDMNAVVKGIQETIAETIQAIATNVTSLNNGESGKCSN